MNAVKNTRRSFWSGMIGSALLTLTAVAAWPQDPRWKQVEEAMQSGLPKTAIEVLGGISQNALAEKKYAEAAKAIAQRISLENTIDVEPGTQNKLKQLQAELDKAPAELKPVLQAIVANWYWEFYSDNQWQFMQRTQTADAPPGDDMLTWALPQILSEIDRQFGKVLAFGDELKQIPIAQFNDLFEKGTVPDSYRPTLYDVLAHGALDFYESPENAVAKEEFAFQLDAGSPIFADVAEFLTWNPVTEQKESRTLKAILLYQELLRFHQNDDDRSAFHDLDLARLQFGDNTAVGEEKAARYKAALRRFADKAANHELSSRALELLAEELREEGNLAEAHTMAEQGKARFPESLGGRGCANLIAQIEAPSLQIATERVWNAPLPTVDVTYQNLTQVHLRVVPFNFETYIGTDPNRSEGFDPNQFNNLLAVPPAAAWTATLPATTDFKLRTEKLAAPQDLKPGFYYLLASLKADFSRQPNDGNMVSLAGFWVSDLAIVTRSDHATNQLDGFVLNASSGEPVAGATVRAWGWKSEPGKVVNVTLPAVQTNETGRFVIRTDQQMIDLRIHVTSGNHALSSTGHLQLLTQNPVSPLTEQTIFFTDRALYRPGQTIQFKGIVTSSNQATNAYKVISNRALNVVFQDANGQEIERLAVKTNDYGSFSGSVTAPRDRLTGQMLLFVEGGPHGATQVRVEEYKRPKFQVKVAPPAAPARLNGEVVVKGTALAYTGAAIDGAQVKYRVVRQVRYPVWWGFRNWWLLTPPQPSQEIAHGTAKTGSDGSFEVKFIAKADASVAESAEPTFQFSITADVTDGAGETRSGSQSVTLGYTAISASLTAATWQEARKPVEITVRTQTVNGDNTPARGTLKVYALKQPDKVQRPPLANESYNPRFVGMGGMGAGSPRPDPSRPDSWENGDLVLEKEVSTNDTGTALVSAPLGAGIYRASFTAADSFGKKVTAELPIKVLDPAAGKLNIKVPFLVSVEKTELEPGQELRLVWGSGYDQARAFVEVEHRHKILQSFWTEPGATQQVITVPVSEEMRGGFTVHVTMVRENRFHADSTYVSVPWTNKKLAVTWEHFVSRLEPGQKETWTVVVKGPDAMPAAAEFVAALYDASLDAFTGHTWPAGFSLFYNDFSNRQTGYGNQLVSFNQLHYGLVFSPKDVTLAYRHFPADLAGEHGSMWGMDGLGGGMGGGMQGVTPLKRNFVSRAKGMVMFGAPAVAAAPAPMEMNAPAVRLLSKAEDAMAGEGREATTAGAVGDLPNVSARKNLNETAFFFPHLTAGKDGTIRMEFTMPEALTEWTFLGFAHDKDLRAGLLTDKAITSKDLMVQPNPPRFVREGDTLEFTVKVSNKSATRQAGTARLSLADLVSLESVDARLGNTTGDQAFDIPAGESQSFAWKIHVPDGLGPLSYKAVASTGRVSDGEEGYLPVLPRRVLVQEALPLPIRGPGTKAFTFQHLADASKSASLKSESLTVQMVSNPSWYAVMALPYLMEYPYECSEQVFNRLYANALAQHIALSDPKIRRVFDAWKLAGGNTLDSPLEKNQDLKSVLLEETPWVRQGKAESQARRNLGILFDTNRLGAEMTGLMAKLGQQQLEDGRWPWFPGGRADDFITLYITTGFGRLRHLGVNLDVAPAVRALDRLDAWSTELYQRIPADKRAGNHLASLTALYLYGRSYFLQDKPVADPHKEALQFWLLQAKTHWLTLPRQNQGHLAVALKRFGHLPAAQAIMASLKERSSTNEEMGMSWRNEGRSWWWYQAPIETQALMIEAFDEVAADAQAVEDCKVWLLKQKQTQDWKTTKATADAVYALLLRGSNLLASDALVQVNLGDVTVQPQKTEAGTGFYEQRFTGDAVKPEQGKISVTKKDAGVAWGSIHWQYLEDMTKVPSFAETPLKLTKELYIKENTAQGPTLRKVAGPVHVGDELVVRLVLKTDRDMEYIHLKDFRGSGTEPVNVLSGYQFREGLRYYESTRDVASHFFIDLLPVGTYVFEYSVRVQLKGAYQTGFANIECMYAPEFNSHSESLELKVE